MRIVILCALPFLTGCAGFGQFMSNWANELDRQPIYGRAPAAAYAPLPTKAPCPVTWGAGQVGQSGQRGQGANCY